MRITAPATLRDFLAAAVAHEDRLSCHDCLQSSLLGDAETRENATIKMQAKRLAASSSTPTILRSRISPWTRSSCSKATRRGRSCSRRRCASSRRTSSESSSRSLASTSRSRTGARRQNAVVHEAAAAIREHGFGLKAATITPERRGRRRLAEPDPARGDRRQGHRPHGAAHSRVVPLGGVHAPISVVRMAVGDAYGAKEWREGEGDDEVAFRTERIERRVCRAVAEFAFRQAERMDAKVFGGPKYTVSPIYEGMLKEEMDAAARAASGRAVRAAAHRRDLRAAHLVERRTDGHSGAQSRRRHPLRPRPAALRLDRRLGVAARRVRGRLRPERAHGRGRARDRAGARGEGRREPDGDDPRGRGASLPRRGGARSRPPAGRSARRVSRPSPTVSGPPISVATRGTTEFTDEVIRRTRTKLDVWASLVDELPGTDSPRHGLVRRVRARMRVAVPRETAPGERRVALVPETVSKLRDGGFEVQVERGAGAAAGFADDAYAEAGAELVDAAARSPSADGVACVARRPPSTSPSLGAGHRRRRLPRAADRRRGIARLRERGVVAFAMESIPRITRAQSMDALSSQATVAGYKAVVLAADRVPKLFPMLMTAAGTIAPVRALVIGAGVAGLQAIATARRLGAVVSAFDVRPAVKEQVESLGAVVPRPRRPRGGDRRRLRDGADARAAGAAADGARGADPRLRRRRSRPRPFRAGRRRSSSRAARSSACARARSSSTSRPRRAATAS